MASRAVSGRAGCGGACAIIGLVGVMQGRTWAPTVAALGMLAWLIGHWSFAIRNVGRYRSPLECAVIGPFAGCAPLGLRAFLGGGHTVRGVEVGGIA